VTEAAMGRLCAPARRGTSSDELWHAWCALDRLIGEADEKAHKEAGGAFDLYLASPKAKNFGFSG
jgi:hypothetical protein